MLLAWCGPTELSKPPAYANGVATDIWVTTMDTEQTSKKTKTKISHKSEHKVPAILGFFVIGSFIHDENTTGEQQLS